MRMRMFLYRSSTSYLHWDITTAIHLFRVSQLLDIWTDGLLERKRASELEGASATVNIERIIESEESDTCRLCCWCWSQFLLFAQIPTNWFARSNSLVCFVWLVLTSHFSTFLPFWSRPSSALACLSVGWSTLVVVASNLLSLPLSSSHRVVSLFLLSPLVSSTMMKQTVSVKKKRLLPTRTLIKQLSKQCQQHCITTTPLITIVPSTFTVDWQRKISTSLSSASSSTTKATTTAAHRGSFLFPFNVIFVLPHPYYHLRLCCCFFFYHIHCLSHFHFDSNCTHKLFLSLSLTFHSLSFVDLICVNSISIRREKNSIQPTTTTSSQ